MPRRRARGRRRGFGRGGAGAACDEPYQPRRVGFRSDSSRPLPRPVRPRARTRRATSCRGRRGRTRARGRRRHAGAPQEARARRLGVEHRDEAREAARREPARLRDRARRGPRGRRRRRERRGRRSGLHQHHPRCRGRGRAREDHRRRRRAPTATATRSRGSVINLEFVSANPTGPLHIGHTRWAALGDSIGRVLRAAGADGRDASTTSTTPAARWTLRRARCSPRPRASRPPRTATRAATSPTSPRGCSSATRTSLELDDAVALHTAPRDRVRAAVRRDPRIARRFNVHFDVWLRGAPTARRPTTACPTSTRPSNDCARRATSSTRTAPSGCARPTSATTRTASSVAPTASTPTSPPTPRYYLDKSDRGFEHKIYLLGADHHGYVHRLKALAGAAGDDPETRHRDAHRPAVSASTARKLSKRAGNIIELDDLQAWLGTDAAALRARALPGRFAAHIDPELLQQAHQRQSGVLRAVRPRAHPAVARNAAASGVDRSAFAPELLDARDRGGAARCAAEFPRIVAQAAELREPHRIARYIEELAGVYHRWYDNCRVHARSATSRSSDLHRTRLWLNDATGQVLRNGLGLLGVSARPSGCRSKRPNGGSNDRDPAGAPAAASDAVARAASSSSSPVVVVAHRAWLAGRSPTSSCATSPSDEMAEQIEGELACRPATARSRSRSAGSRAHAVLAANDGPRRLSAPSSPSKALRSTSTSPLQGVRSTSRRRSTPVNATVAAD